MKNELRNRFPAAYSDRLTDAQNCVRLFEQAYEYYKSEKAIARILLSNATEVSNDNIYDVMNDIRFNECCEYHAITSGDKEVPHIYLNIHERSNSIDFCQWIVGKETLPGYWDRRKAELEEQEREDMRQMREDDQAARNDQNSPYYFPKF